MSEQPLVLVADDDPDILDLVAFRLERAGLAVACATDGERALRLARERLPRIAVLDVMMPALDGLAVTRAIRADARTAAITVVLLTAGAQEEDVARGLEAGADHYMTKPFSPKKLVELVAGLPPAVGNSTRKR